MIADEKMLTPTELTMMHALWELGEATVNQVRTLLEPKRPLAYTSVSTILRILEKKGVVTSKKVGKAHLYAPLISRDQYESLSIEHIVDKVFDATPSALVRRLIADKKLNKKEIQEIRDLLQGK